MSLPSIDRRRCGSIVRAALLIIGVAPACGNSVAAVPDAGHDDGTTCPPPPGGLDPEYLGSGIVVGAGVSASLCNVGVLLYTDSDAPDQFFLRLDYPKVPSVVEFQLPAGAMTGDVRGFISMRAPVSGSGPTPGTYTSADSPCGTVGFDYQLPLASQPRTLSFSFDATAAASCAEGTQTAAGSWALTLSSVAAYQADGGALTPDYTAHGQLTAGVVGLGTGETATLALAF